MISFSSKRAVSPFFFALTVVALLNCGGGSGAKETFTTAGDTAVTQGVVGTWEGIASDGRTFTLTLCEDDAPRSTALSCETLHKVQGDGRGTAETTEQPQGCGGCDYDYSLYVNGTLSGRDAVSTPIQGQFGLAGGDANGLAFPYEVHATSIDTPAQGGGRAVTINGKMRESGTFTIDALVYPQGPVDAGASAANDAEVSMDAGTAPAPSSSSSSSSVGSGPSAQASAVVFHRSGDAVCPSK